MTTAPIPEFPADQLGRLLGAGSPMPASVLLGPAVGEDACALDVDGAVVVAATDPITLTGSDVGRYAVHINAHDVAVAGARPRWFLAAILLPRERRLTSWSRFSHRCAMRWERWAPPWSEGTPR